MKDGKSPLAEFRFEDVLIDGCSQSLGDSTATEIDLVLDAFTVLTPFLELQLARHGLKQVAVVGVAVVPFDPGTRRGDQLAGPNTMAGGGNLDVGQWCCAGSFQQVSGPVGDGGCGENVDALVGLSFKQILSGEKRNCEGAGMGDEVPEVRIEIDVDRWTIDLYRFQSPLRALHHPFLRFRSSSSRR